MGEMYHATPEAAIAHARKTMDSPECAHGEQGFCVACHDASNR
jgi:cytochrome c553